MGMITDETFGDYLHCGRKAFLKAAGTSGILHDIERIQSDLDGAYSRRALGVYLARYGEREIVSSPPSLEAAIEARARIILDAIAMAGNVRSRIQLIEAAEHTRANGISSYVPVMFVRNDKVTLRDKLLLAFQAHALASVLGRLPAEARIIHGEEYRSRRVRIEPLIERVRKLIEEIEVGLARDGPPTLILNGHCNVCEFRCVCRGIAEATDDLSLLRGLSEKEIQKLRNRGIVTVAQLSHAYRPGRRGKRRAGESRKHDPALQALAIREKRVFVLDRPMMPSPRVALYLDVEGIPDRDSYYLIGLLAVAGDQCTSYSFWADDSTQERTIWRACAEVIEGFGDYTVYHYGRYELDFLDRMRQTADDREVALLDRLRSGSCNVLAAIYSHFYFPTRSNSLKDIGMLLGAQEDCLALRKITEFVLSACNDTATPPETGPPVISAEDIRQRESFRFGKAEFFCKELDYINKCAYSDYQNERVYVRTCPALRKSRRRKHRASKIIRRADKIIEFGRPERCPNCGGNRVRTHSGLTNGKTVYDLRFTATGVKSRAVRYKSRRYSCGDCKSAFPPAEYHSLDSRFGDGLISWVIYHHVAMRQTIEDVRVNLNEVFGLSFGYQILNRIKPRAADRYRETYVRLKEKLRRGSLIHADETRARVRGHDGYVWAFTSLEEVVYAYTPSREGTILEDILAGFGGVLVSDFYSAYDSPKCAQQKCLIHLARDINDDLFHSPFDEELKKLAQAFVAVLKPIVDTIDRFGLKCCHLRKHRQDVERFYGVVDSADYRSEAAGKYQKRIQKYRASLFTFLDHDGIPWNNNNAENAIKGFVPHRKTLGPAYGEQGVRDYLVFLSIYQTCRLKGVSFLKFLRSGLLDLDAFIKESGRRDLGQGDPSPAGGEARGASSWPRGAGNQAARLRRADGCDANQMSGSSSSS